MLACARGCGCVCVFVRVLLAACQQGVGALLWEQRLCSVCRPCSAHPSCVLPIAAGTCGCLLAIMVRDCQRALYKASLEADTSLRPGDMAAVGLCCWAASAAGRQVCGSICSALHCLRAVQAAAQPTQQQAAFCRLTGVLSCVHVPAGSRRVTCLACCWSRLCCIDVFDE